MSFDLDNLKITKLLWFLMESGLASPWEAPLIIKSQVDHKTWVYLKPLVRIFTQMLQFLGFCIFSSRGLVASKMVFGDW